MALIYDCNSFDASKLSFDTTGLKWVSFNLHHRLFDMLIGYIASHLVDDLGNGYRMDVLRSKTPASDENPLGNTQFGRIAIKIGYGEYKFRTFDGDEVYAVYQHIGKPVGSDCGPDMMQNLIIFTKSLESFGLFLSELVTLSEKPEEGKFVCFTWLIRHQFWREEVRVNNRPMQSVVLPSAMKDRLLNDVEKFLSPKTKDFYFRNGIPYRRSYLFHGAPGTGKTSMVQAIAGHFKRNVCFLLPTHPEMTDDNLRDAIQSIPDNSIVVFEDIDALFTKGRENKSNKSALTFSGLLNALDGIGSPNGQIFVLTTNLRENLDHALIRNGRVDLHIEFTYAVKEQMKSMWENFYPDALHLSDAFADAVETSLDAKKLHITTSSLQHFFITQMEATAEEALAAVPTIVEELLHNSSSSMLEAAKNEGGKKNKRNNNKKREVREEEHHEDEEEEEVNDVDLEVVGTSITIPTTANTSSESRPQQGEEGKRKKGKPGQKARKRARELREREQAKAQGTFAPSDLTALNTDESAPAITTTATAETGEVKKERRERRNRERGNEVQTEVVYVKGGSSKTKEADEIIASVKDDLLKAVEMFAPSSTATNPPSTHSTTIEPETSSHDVPADVNEGKSPEPEAPLPPRKDRKQRNSKPRSNSSGSATSHVSASEASNDPAEPLHPTTHEPEATTTETHEATTTATLTTETHETTD